MNPPEGPAAPASGDTSIPTFAELAADPEIADRKSTRLNSSHIVISYAVFCLKKKTYAEKFHAGPGWLFLTGNEDDIKLVGKKLGLSSLTDFQNRDGHQPSLMIGNEPTGEWMRNSAVDNPRFLATTMSNFFGNPKGAATALTSYANAPAMPDIGSGGYLFRSRCSACHTIGMGASVGPDLAGVTSRR